MSTKKLARELGLIRKRREGLVGESNQPVSKQLFSYLIVIDFESTCWREKNNYGQEIIEFPAVLMNTTSGEIESEFHCYVQPQEHPVLSAFCTELTGITQKQVEAGVPLRICLSKFMRWLHKLQHEKGVVFGNATPSAPPPTAHLCAFVTWSDWDLGVCLLYECKRKQISKPAVLNSWIDLRATYRGFYSRKPKGLRGALQDLGVEFSGREHSGLDDARNTACLAWRMILDGCVMKITKSLNRLKTRPLCGDVRKGAHDNKQPLNSENQTSKSLTAPTTVCQSLVSPHTVLTSLTIPVCVSTPLLHSSSNMTSTTHWIPHTSTLDLTPDPETPGYDWPEDLLLTDVGESGCYDDVLLTEDGESGSYDDVLLENEISATGDVSHAHTPRANQDGSHTHTPRANQDGSHTHTPRANQDGSHTHTPRANQDGSHTHTPRANQDSANSHFSEDTHASSRTQSVCHTGLNERVSGTLSHITDPADVVPVPVRTGMPHPSRPLPFKPHVCRIHHSEPLPFKPHPSRTLLSKPHPSRPASSFAPPLPLLDPYKSLTRRGLSTTTTPSIPLTIYREQSDPASERSKTSGGSFHVLSSVLSSSVNNSTNSSCSVNKSRFVSSNTQSAVSSCSVNQSVLSNQSVKQSSNSFCSNQSALSSSSTKQLLRPPHSAGVKITSPLCDCGRRAKRLTVCNGGPNHGRVFYTCTVRKSIAAGPAPHGGCGFFKWESALLKSSSLGQTTMTLNSTLTRTASRTFR